MDTKITEIKEDIKLLFKNKWQFLLLFLSIFFVTFTFFSIIGFVPKQDSKTIIVEAAENTNEIISQLSEPVHITIPSVGVDVNIENPKSRDIGVLDSALSNGAVHYPDTGSLEEDANIFLFGHSSFLPNIINKNYQAFNGLRKLKGGEEIFVDSKDVRHVYRVTSVELAKAEEIQVDLSRGTRKLTLSTCNSFGDESERYIVEAEFVGSYLLVI